MKINSAINTLLLLSIFVVIVIFLFGSSLTQKYYLIKYEDKYKKLSMQCHIAKSENNKFLNLPNDIDDITRIHLEKSKNIALLECLEKENLFLTLNEIGISEKKLKKIEFNAAIDSDTRAKYLANEMKNK